ncbi:MAG: pyridoxal-phosphate dependent enzyme [Gemmatimonadetes bacterium]|nr:pyridoxal-phosphate dependent enzyme [Gemmatimonadota bacterium]
MAPRNTQPCRNVLETIGWTPLIRLNRVVDGARTPVYGKAECFNPGGSLKDRIGVAMIEAAEGEGRLGPGGVVVEATAGNTGVALALVAAIKGYRCIFTVPDKFSQEKIRLLKAFGAEVIVTPTALPPDHPDYYLNVARRIAEETPNAILANQFYNPANPEAHYRTTGREIWEQTGGNVTHWVASAGTGGTLTGVARCLKERNPNVRVIAGDPIGSVYLPYYRTGRLTPGGPYKVEGVGNDKIPSTYDLSLVDEMRPVTDREAFLMARRLTREEGLLVGGSAGLIVHVAVQVAHEVDDPSAWIVALLPDTGERYLSKFHSDEWMRENRMLEAERVTAEALIAEKEAGTPPLIAVEPGATVRQALGLIDEYNISQLPVLSQGDCVGSVSEATLMARVIEDPGVLDQAVENHMDAPFPVVESHVGLESLTKLLTRQNPAVLVRQNSAIVGIITRFDVLRRITGIGRSTL